MTNLQVRTCPKRRATTVVLALVSVALWGCSGEPDTATAAGDGPQAVVAATGVMPPQSVSVANSFRHILRSEEIGQDFYIDVALPYIAPDEPMPVVYVTDGNSMFPIVANTARLLQLGGELPPLIVVGIGYVTSQTMQVLALRTRDLTPTVDEAFLERSRNSPGALPEGISAGGAAAFLDFIEREVKPFVAERYPVKPEDATLVGDSLGGLFTLYALFNRTDDYQRYLAGSPSLWWDEQTLFDDEASFSAGAQDLDVDLFLSVGALEEDADNPEDWAKMVSNTRSMASRLESHNYPSLRMKVNVFEGETHLSVIPATLSRGLREVFATDVATGSD